VKVTSSQASIKVKAFITTSVKPGQVYLPMHFEQTNKLTQPSFDPYSRQPSYKYCAVKVEKS